MATAAPGAKSKQVLNSGFIEVPRSTILKRDFGGNSLRVGALFQKMCSPETEPHERKRIFFKIATDPSYEPVTLRSVDEEAHYTMRRNHRKEFGISAAEMVEAQLPRGFSWSLSKNPFPYELEEGFTHYLLWIKHIPEGSQESRVREILNHTFPGRRLAFYTQLEEHKSIPEISHWHVLAETSAGNLNSQSLSLRAILTDNLI